MNYSKKKNIISNIEKINSQNFINYFSKITFHLFYWVFSSLYKIEINNISNMDLSNKSIIATTYHSLFNGPIVLGICRKNKNRTRTFVKGKCFESLIGKIFLSYCGGIPIFSKNIKIIIRIAIEALNKNESLLIFPEGQKGNEEEVQKLYKGTAFLALKTNTPILPIGISNIDNCNFLKRKRIYIEIGEPIYSKDEYSKQNSKKLTKIVNRELKKLFSIANKKAINSY